MNDEKEHGLWGREWDVFEGQGERNVKQIATPPFYDMDYAMCNLIHTFERSTSGNTSTRMFTLEKYACALRVTSVEKQNGDWLNSCL